ncbi:MAG: aspartate aminotransferase family protein [Bacillota bacterium]
MPEYIETYRRRTPGSAALYDRAKKVMPGGVSHNPRFYPPYPIYIDRAEGSKIWDVDGNEYVDLWMGHFTHILGHKPEPVAGVLRETAEIGSHWGILTPWQVEFAEDICRLVPCAEALRFGVSGTEATMHALRIARAHTGRRIVLKVRGGWHGSNNDLATMVHHPMDIPESAGLPPQTGEFTKGINFNDLEGTVAAIRRYAPDLAAVLIEAVGQYFVPPVPGYLETVQAEAKKAGAVFILDEVITGFRLGLGGAQARYGLRPDLTTMGKVLGAGSALGLVAGRRDLMALTDPTAGLAKDQIALIGGGTFSGMLPAMRGGRALLRHLEAHQNEIYPALEEKGRRVREGVEAAMRAHGVRVKCFGVGSLYSVSFPRDDRPVDDCESIEAYTDVALRNGEFKARMLNHGVFTQWGGGAVSAAHNDADIEHIIRAAGEVAKEMAAGR